MPTLATELAFSPSPEFEVAVICASSSAEAAKRRAEALVGSARLAIKPLACSVNAPRKKQFLGHAAPHEETTADLLLAEALSESSGRELEPLSAALRLLTPIRQTLSDKVHPHAQL
jgi:hypothetical protein